MLYLVKWGLRLAHLMVVEERSIWHASLDKKAREIWFLCRQYDARSALEMGLVNQVVPYAELERETVGWCRGI